MNRMDSDADYRAIPAAANTLLSVGELKRHSLRESLRRIHDQASSILLFSLQWNELEDHYSAVEASLKCRAVELASLESSVLCRLKEAIRWASLLGDCAEGKLRVLEEKVMGLAVMERGFVREVEERLKMVEELERTVEHEGAVVCEEMRWRAEELEGLFEKVKIKEEMLERRDRDLGCREKNIDNVKRELEEAHMQVVSREKEMGAMGKEIEERMVEIVAREKMVEFKEEMLERRDRDLGCREKIVENEKRELEEAKRQVVSREKEFESREMERGAMGKEIEERMVEIVAREKIVEFKEKMFEDWHKEIESKKKVIEERFKEVRLKEKSLAECSKEVELRYEESNKHCEMKMTELKMIEKRLEERANQIEEKEREVNRVIVGADLKKKIIEDHKKAIQEPRKVSGNSVDRSPLAQGDMKGKPAKKTALAEEETMLDDVLSHDGKALQTFLIKNWDADVSFRHKVIEIIKSSLNPARLVLDALQAFSPSCSKKDNSGAKCNIYRKESCLMLLEELRNISPEIALAEKAEALKLSFIWYRTMKGDAEIVNFLNLLAAYKIASFYSVDSLLEHVGKVRYSRKMPELCQVLGFTDKIPGFIQDLVKCNNLPSAIRFINAFKLNDVFPVEPLVNKCIGDSADADKSNSITAQKDRKRRRNDMIALMKCIQEYKIRFKHTERIKEIISSLGGQNPNLEIGASRVDRSCRSTMLTSPSPATAPLSVNSVADTTSGVMPNCHLNEQSKVSIPIETIQGIIDDATPMHHLPDQQTQIGQGKPSDSKKNGSNELSGKVDGRNLKIIFDGEVDSDKAREKAYELLCRSPDSARLILDALKDNVSSNMTEEEDIKLGMPSRVCIQLLGLLRRVSPVISNKLHEDAKEFAVTWKSKLKARADDYVGIASFLLFLSTFKLSPAFDAGEILGLLDPASWRKHVLHTFDIFGMEDAMPDFIQKLVDKNHWLYAIKYAHTFGMEDKFPFEPLLKDYMAYWEKRGTELCEANPGSPLIQMKAIEKMLVATRIVIKCVNFYKLESRSLMQGLEAREQQLSRQKADIAMKLKDSIMRSDGSSRPASEQETEEEPTVTGNSPSSCSNDYAPVSANVPTSTKASVAGPSSAYSKDGFRVSARSSTLGKPATVPGNAPPASANTRRKRPNRSTPQDHNPQAKRQAQDRRPCWGG